MQNPEYLPADLKDELEAILAEYQKTGETPDELDEEWFDEMIERVTAQQLREELKVQKSHSSTVNNKYDN